MIDFDLRWRLRSIDCWRFWHRLQVYRLTNCAASLWPGANTPRTLAIGGTVRTRTSVDCMPRLGTRVHQLRGKYCKKKKNKRVAQGSLWENWKHSQLAPAWYAGEPNHHDHDDRLEELSVCVLKHSFFRRLQDERRHKPFCSLYLILSLWDH